jgi:Cu/Ag efflux pump CusA
VAAVALVVDDAVAGVQQVTARLDEQDRPVVSVPTVVRDAVLEVRTAVVYPAAITVLVVLPVFFLDGQQRALYQPLALAYLVAIVASTVVALTLVPALYVVVGTGRRRARREPLAVRKLYRSGGRVVRAGLRRPRRVLVLAAVAALVGLGSVPFLTTAVLPTVQDPNLLVRFDGPPGTSLPEMDRLTAAATAELRSIPGVRAAGSQVGRAVLGDQVVSVNSAQMWVNLDPAADIDATTAAVRRAVHSYPGIKGHVSTAEAQTTTDILGAPGADLTVRLFGQDIGAMRAKAQEVRQMLSGVDGVVNPQVEQQVEKPTLLLDVDLAAADRAGIKPGDVRRAAATLLAGVEVGSLFQDQKIFEVVVKGTPETRQSPSSVRDLLIDTPTGGRVSLGDVAAVRVAPGTDVIEREDVSRRVDVTATVSGRSVGAVTDEVEQRLKQIPFPSENHAEVLGDRAEQQAGLARVLAVAVAALLGTFLLFQGAFASWRLATGMLLALPVALVGGVLAILLAGRSVSLGSLLGLLLVLGLAARNAVLLVRRGRRMVAEGEPFGAGLVLRATRDQAGPMLTTALATAAILTPALFVGAAGLEIVKPMAVAALGGLVTAVIVGLLAVPALYLLVGSGHAVHPDLDPTTD